eukprot:m.2484 g.2484  ORF g.2484 m.2484 type:complete len:438 (-) comp1805_c0_seq1:151-1464(-)
MKFLQSVLAPIIKDVPLHATVKSHRLLLQAGFIDQSASGMFSILPLGFRVLQKLKTVIRQELGKMGAEELYLPIITEASLWKESGRWDQAGDELFRLKDRKEHQYCLAATHEETVTKLIASHVTTYRQLPIYVYQTQTKFRDEQRPRHGLVRAREFIMKDMYTFDISKDDAIQTYERAIEAYKSIFSRINLPVEIVAADTGMIGGNLSHEFHVPTTIGEDTLVSCNTCHRAVNLEKIQELFCTCQFRVDGESVVEASDSVDPPSSRCDWVESKGIEVGHAFYLGTKYSELFNAQFTSNNGNLLTIEMGCYGIGVSRILSALAEVRADEEGLNWPKIVAPYEICLCVIGKTNFEEKMEYCKDLYDQLSTILPGEVIVDNRVSGKFKNRIEQLRMIGIPTVVFIGDKALQDKTTVEVLNRASSNLRKIDLDEFISKMKK